MTHAAIHARFEELVALLDHERIVNCESRRGIRRRTGALLEDAFLALAVALEPDLSVEIGAHEAGFSARLKRRRPHIQAWAFEANPYVFEKYVNAPDHALESVEYRNVAIGSVSGLVDFYIPTRFPKGSLRKANAISSLYPRVSEHFAYEVARVRASTLDEALSGLDCRTAVAWIDVEGAQRDVIEGAPRFLSRATAIYIEVETMELWAGQTMAHDVSDLLAPFGFVRILRDNLAHVQFNEVYIKNDERSAGVASPIVSQYVDDVRSALLSDSQQ